MNNLKTALAFGGILAQSDIDYAATRFEKRILKTGEYFQQVGELANEIGFVSSGILRVSAISNKGEEVTKYFVRANQFVVDLESYYDQKASDSALQAVVPSEVLAIHRNAWNKLSEKIPKLYILTKSLTEAALLNKIKDNDFLNFGTAQDKYSEFLKRYPDLALSVPQQYIASYLKITPQSLSRIRNKSLRESKGRK